MNLFNIGLAILIVLCFGLYCFTNKVTTSYKDDIRFSKFQRVYLTVYLLAMSIISFLVFFFFKLIFSF